MIASGQTIKELNIFTPFNERTRHNGLTYGVGPAGYDVTVEFDEDGSTDHIIMMPGAFALASTIEHFTMPKNLLGVVHDKSTWARKGLTVQNTVIEPGWCGYLTLELVNHNQNQMLKLRRGDPIAQIIFHFLDKPASVAYDGKYQNQKRGPVQAIFEPGSYLP
jgi:dCTP deaminase